MFASPAVVACLTALSWSCSPTANAPAPAQERPSAAPAPQQRAEDQGELTPKIAASIPPFPPSDVEVKTSRRAATIVWEKSVLENVKAYRVYRTVGEKTVLIGETSSARFVDKFFKPGHTYSVTAVNVYGAESPQATASPAVSLK
jgi:hypothetical protein